MNAAASVVAPSMKAPHMDELARFIGYAVLAVAALALYVYLSVRFVFFRKAVGILALSVWGAVGVIGVPMVAYLVHFKNGNYFVALATLVIGGVVYLPWFALGLPALLQRLGLRKGERW